MFLKHLGIVMLVGLLVGLSVLTQIQKKNETLAWQLYRLGKGVSAEAAHETTVQSSVQHIYMYTQLPKTSACVS